MQQPTHDTARMDDSDSNDSDVQSCISNEEDFSEDDDVEYLAMEVVNYLPEDKASKLMSNLRAKERAIQDLLRRNQSLLEMCDKLDKENQSTSERCDELSRRAEVAEKSAAEAKPKAQEPTQETKGPQVDTSYFMKLEQRKEEKITHLIAENERLVAINRRCQEQVAQMDARMQELVKESKQLRKEFQGKEKRSAPAPATVAMRSPEMDEEERLYQELQQSEQADMIARRMKEQMLEQRRKLSQMLEQVLTRDVLGALCGWDSELSALDMQVEGVEKSIGSVNKGLRGQTSASGEAAGAGGKKKQNKKGEDARLDSAWVDETSSQLLDLFEAMRANLDVVDTARHALEEASQRLTDGSDSEILNAIDSEGTLHGAEIEAEQIREQNASLVERVSSVGLKDCANLLDEIECASQMLQNSAPPGILPPGVEHLLSQNTQKLVALKTHFASQSSVLLGLQEDSVSIGRRVKTLQSELKTHRALLRERISQSLTTSLRPVCDAESRLMDALRKQRSLEDKARKDATDFLEEFSTAVKRAGPSTGGGADTSGPSVAVVKENCTDAAKGAKEVRASVATLRGGLTRVHRELAGKLSLVLDAIAGEPEPNSSKSQRQQSEEAADTAESKDKRKKNKKKGKAQVEGKNDAPPKDTPTAAEEVSSESYGACHQKEKVAPAQEASKKVTKKQEVDEDAALRAEIAREFAKDGKPAEPQKAKSGKDLLKELKNLKSASDSLEERIAARLAKKLETPTDETGETDTKESQKNAAKKKKRYA